MDQTKIFVNTYVANILSKYQYPHIAKQDVSIAFQEYRSLRPKLSTYHFNDGSKKELACLDGTIPVIFKGKCYHIPVCIWLLESHPYNSPICFVRPTAKMRLMTSRHIDPNGKVHLPYLQDWNPDSSDLLGLIQVMIIEFGERPPVYTTARLLNTSTSTTAPFQAELSRDNSNATGGLSSTNSSPLTTNQNPPTAASTKENGTETIHASLPFEGVDKVKKRLREVLTQSQAEMEVLKKIEHLNEGKAKLDDIIRRLQNEQSNLEKNILIWRSKETDEASAKVKK